MRLYYWVLVLILCGVSLGAFAQTAPLTVSPGQPPVVLIEQKTYRLTNRYEVKNISQRQLTTVNVRVLIGAESTSPYQTNLSYRIVPVPKTTERDAQGNVYGMLELGPMKPGVTRMITVEKLVTNSGIEITADLANMDADYTQFLAQPMNQIYLKPSNMIESAAKDIKALATSFVTITPAPARARAIFNLVNTTVEYDPASAYANKGALSALRTKRGVCTEFASLFVALCRATNIPARVVSGYWETDPVDPENPINEKPYRHSWAEFYLPAIGWVPVEPSMLVDEDGARIPSPYSFARILPNSRHYVWSYGFGAEKGGNIEVHYQYEVSTKEPPTNSTDSMVTAALAYESITEVPDTTTLK